MSDKEFYTVPFVWSRTVWVVTFGVFALWIGGVIWMLYQIFADESMVEPIIGLIVLNAIMLPIVILCEGYAPQRLEIGRSKLVVLRRYNSVTIPRHMIKRVLRLPDNAMRTAVRTFGVGGLFGYFGAFYARKIGSFQLYATRLDNLFLIELCDNRRVVVSCAEPERMSLLLE